jgi:hypothetical protein
VRKIAWLQVGQRDPRPFKTAAEAKRAAADEAARAVAKGWEQARGSVALGRYELVKGDQRRMILVSVVDEEGWETLPSGFRRRCAERFRGVRPD